MLWGKIKPRGPGVREWDAAVSRRCRTELLTEKVALSKDLKEMRRRKPWGSRRQPRGGGCPATSARGHGET